MDRRNFLKTALAATVAAATAIPQVKGAKKEPEKNRTVTGVKKDGARLKVRFLGTGAADWRRENSGNEFRRCSSLLIDDRILIDLTEQALEMIPQGVKPEAVFYTHSHSDHFRAEALKESEIRTAYMSGTWSRRAKELLGEEIKINALKIGTRSELGDIQITALPANHCIGSDPQEQAMMYLIEKGGIRLLYATDTGYIPIRAARIIGIDPHVRNAPAITAFIMEATMGMGHDEDFRMFTHSSVESVLRYRNMMLQRKRYLPAPGQPVFITHIAHTFSPEHAALQRALPEGIQAAYDGLEYTFQEPEILEEA